MTRRTNDLINTDREIIDLRMQAEDLINNIENFSDEEYAKQATHIKEQIDKRISEILNI